MVARTLGTAPFQPGDTVWATPEAEHRFQGAAATGI